MGTHTISQTDDGKHAIRDADGRVAEVLDPETNARSVAQGFDSQAEARKAAEAAGIDVGTARPKPSGGGATKAARKSGARRT